jgi:hypothetical protein
MNNWNFLGSFDSVWIHLKLCGYLLILRFANMWNVLTYYTCPHSIQELLCMLLLPLYWWSVLLSIFPTCSFVLLWPPSHAFLFLSFFFCYSFFFVNSVLLLTWSSDGYYKFTKLICYTILLKFFIYLFIYLFITQGLVIDKTCTIPLEPVWLVWYFIYHVITFSVLLYDDMYV